MEISSIVERAIQEGKFIVATKATVRQTAPYFGVSKTTVFRDVTKILPTHNSDLAEKVREILDLNKKERAYRGGQACKRRWQKIKETSLRLEENNIENNNNNIQKE